MAVSNIHTDFIRLRETDDTPGTGLTIELLPDGSSAPGGLVALTANAAIAWQYDFPAGITNGIHKVYVGGVPLQQNGVDVEIMVIRGGVVTPGAETDFISDYDGV